MRDAGTHLNLKGHYVGDNRTHLIYAPGDIEVHKGQDERLYVLDCARLFPPEAPSPVITVGKKRSCVYVCMCAGTWGGGWTCQVAVIDCFIVLCVIWFYVLVVF